MYDVTIVGCGVVGASLAYTLSQYRLRVLVLERENDVAMGTTKANSAIVHAGYDPENGTLMAKLNVRGSEVMEQLCRDLSVGYKRIGSFVLAFDEEQKKHLEHLLENGVRNGVPGLRILDAEEAHEMEPNLAENVAAALYAPSAAVIDPWGLCIAEAETAVRNGVELRLRSEVTGLEDKGGHVLVHTKSGDYETKVIVNCAGGWGGDICAMTGETEWEAQPSRGEYYLLDKSSGSLVSHVIFQCPNKLGKGVLVSPTVHGNLIVGPNAVNISDPDGTENTAAGLAFVREMALKSVPSISFRDNIRNFSGVRANHPEDDFLIGENPKVSGFYELAGVKSPGLSSAPAIAKDAARWLAGKTTLMEKTHFIDTRRRIRFNELSAEEKNALIRENPMYGRVICRCETVTEGEIVAAIHSPVPPTTINGVKRRVGAGMGRCQGGFCGPRVQEILSRELGIPMDKILMDQPGTYILTGETKGGAHE